MNPKKILFVLERRVYTGFFRNIFFKFDSERVHRAFVLIGVFLQNCAFMKWLVGRLFSYKNRILEQEILGLWFANPVGLAGGFDKNGEIAGLMKNVGFGFTEVGSLTAKPCLGNKGKRMERLVDKESLWVNIGLANKGVEKVIRRISGARVGIPVGINIAKTNCKETAELNGGLKDYIFSLRRCLQESVGDYYVINISCPNSYGGQDFAEPKRYELLLKEIDKLKIEKPVLIKFSPDLEKKIVDKLLKISERHEVEGFIISNLTKKHRFGKGGLSGKLVGKKADEMLRYVYKKVKNGGGKFVLIGAGGIFNAEDAYRKIKLGADLVQLVTGMIYEGPGVIGEINLGLVGLLEKDGFRNVGEAVGSGV